MNTTIVQVTANIFKRLGLICSYIYSPKIKAGMQYIKAFFYTGYLSRNIKLVGKNARIAYGSKVEGGEFISIGDNCLLGKDVILYAFGAGKDDIKLAIDQNCVIGAGSLISAANKIIIGKGLLTGPNVFITDNSHGNTTKEDLSIPPSSREIVSKGPVIIGDNVWLGRNVTILPNVRLGDNCVIGANSIVTKDIPPFCVAAGCPAKIISRND